MNSAARKTSSDPKGICIALAMVLSLVIPTRLFAAAFTASSLGDYGNVTVMEVSGGYDAENPDKTVNDVPRQAIAREFFKTHKDDYDFVVIFSNFDFAMPEDGQARGFYAAVKNDTLGLGIDRFDDTNLYGSSGRLQGTIDMGNVDKLATDPLDPRFADTLYVLSHELMHRWGASVKFRNAQGLTDASLLGRNDVHWSFLLDSGGSLLYGNAWQDNKNGTFTSRTPQSELKFYSPLDLYLMGMIDKSKVPPMLLIDSPGVDAGQLPQTGVTIAGTARTVTIDDIIAAMGPRLPDAASSQKSFKSAFIFITQPGAFRGDELYGLENIRSGAATRFSILTDGNAIMQIAATPKDEVPVNPGIAVPADTPRIPTPDINAGVTWLTSNQGLDGSWSDLGQTTERDTAEATLTLKNFLTSQTNYQSGVQWLTTVNSGNMDFLARKIEALAGAGQDVATLVNEVLARQNPDGGWGSDVQYASNPLDTALALRALSAAGGGSPQAVAKAIGYLKTKQNPDNGWSSDDKGSMVQDTASVLSVFNKHRGSYALEDQILGGTAWLLGRKNTDNGFGNSRSTVYDSAVAVMALREVNAPADLTDSVVSYLLGLQASDGSWNQSVFQTGLAVKALYAATITPDLSIKAEDMTFIPSSVRSLPTNIVISANVWNAGRTAVVAKAALYDGDPSLGNKIAEQELAFPGLQAATMTFSAIIADGNEHAYTIILDPDGLVKESNELNNRAIKSLAPESTYDFEVLASDVAVSPNAVDFLQDVKISAKVANRGTTPASTVQVKYYLDAADGPFDIATETLSIPANMTIVREITWRANKAGVNMPVVVQIDPFDKFIELSKANNNASVTLTVNADTRPNLTVSYRDMAITPAPAIEGGNSSVSALVKNEGFSPSDDTAVTFSRGVPGPNNPPFDTQTIPALLPGEARQVTAAWTNIAKTGDPIISVQVDPMNQVLEISKTDNIAFLTVDVLSRPDLAVSENSITFSPAFPKDGDQVEITVAMQNKGEQSAQNVLVRMFDNDTLLEARDIPVITGLSQATASFAYDTTGKKGTHRITVSIDPENLVGEQTKDNNSATRVLGIQDSSLWVTEPYFSPNGDGSKDRTQFFFRLDSAQTLTIVVADKNNTVVRSFGGNEFNNAAAGNVVWDGLDDNGMVVQDGQYQLRIMGDGKAVLGSVLVIVDNNRSPLSDAIGTKYLLNSNLTCMLPDINEQSWRWFPDESGLLVAVPGDPATPEYPYGLYTMAPDGQDVQRIVPLDWGLGKDPLSAYHYNYPVYDVSPDGRRVAFILNTYRIVKGYYWDTDVLELSQLWVLDRDGRNPVLLAFYDATEAAILDFKWSPDGAHFIYRMQKADWSEHLRVIGADNPGVSSEIDELGYFNLNYLRWAPDSSQFAYAFGSYDANWNYSEQIRVNDLAGAKRDIFTVNDSTGSLYTDYLEWLGLQKIVLNASNGQDKKLFLLDVAGSSEAKGLSVKAESADIAVAPNRQSFAFTEKDYQYAADSGLITTFLCDADGAIAKLHERPSSEAYCEPRQSRVVWTPDSLTIAFSESVETCVDCSQQCEHPFGPQVVSLDVATNQKNTLVAPLYPLVWLSDGSSLAGYSGLKMDSPDGIYYLNGQGTETSCLPLPEDAWLPSNERKLSPRQRYINYYQLVNPSSVCSGRGVADLWAESSLLNLTTDLQILKEKSTILLKGTAVDLNFEGYQLEYADAMKPGIWNLIAPPSNAPIVGDVLASWGPPSEGTFLVRLTVWDKAGNSASSIKRVSWGLLSSITGIYKTPDIISPDSNSANKVVELHYRVLEPVHLEFGIYDEANNLVRTFMKDHAAPVEDHITWDGRDESLNKVKDGKYRMQVLDYAFFVEVDNTPPDVNVFFSPVTKDEGKQEIYVSLLGHAYDRNLKAWVIEYGAGDVPEEWFEYSKGENSFPTKNAGKVAPNPLYDGTFRTLGGASGAFDLGLLRGKKVRMTAEDRAGNKAVAVSGFLDQGIFLFSRPIIVAGRFMKDDLSVRGVHELVRAVTVRNPLSTLVMQQKMGTTWIDTITLLAPDAAVTGFDWENTHLSKDIYAIRLKGVDILGLEYYSNELPVLPMFSVRTECGSTALHAFNGLQDNLTGITFQFRPNNSSAWTDFKVLNDAELFSASGHFLQALPSASAGPAYEVRMTGIGESGLFYESNIAAYPPECPVGLSFTVAYGSAGCGEISTDRPVLQAVPEQVKSVAQFIGLDYFLETPQGMQLVRGYDLTRESPGNAGIDSTLMPEGAYPVKAELAYVDIYGAAIKTSATNTLIVDRALPTALFTYPSGNSLKLCPVRNTDSKGDWFGIPVEAEVVDNRAVKKYELFYGVGEAPSVWLPATYPVIVNGVRLYKPIAGSGEMLGRIGTWDISNLPESAYSLKLMVTDVVGNVGCTTTSFIIDQIAEITTLTTDKQVFSPIGAAGRNTVTINYGIDEYATVDTEIFPLSRTSNGLVLDPAPIRTLMTGKRHFSGMDHVLWDGKDASGAVVQDGWYGTVVSSTDSCGNTSKKWTMVEVDDTAPTASISYPRAIDPLTTVVVEVKGTVVDTHFRNAVLEAGQGGSPESWLPVTFRSTPVRNNVIGAWNTYGLEGTWTLRLTASDAVDNTSIVFMTIDLASRVNLIKDLTALPAIFSPNNDGKREKNALRYELTDACGVLLEFFDSNGGVRRTASATAPSAGVYSFEWDGTDSAGTVVPDGEYTVKLTATLSSNSAVTQAETVTIVVDGTLPIADMTQPTDGSHHKTDIDVAGTISDANLMEYSLSYTGENGTIALDNGSQNRAGYIFCGLKALVEGDYTLSVKAKDQGESVTQKDIAFSIDRTPPIVKIDSPQEGEYYGGDKLGIDISGGIVEKNLELYSLRYGIGDAPAQWLDLTTGTTIPAAPRLFSWKVGKNDNVADGQYTLSLSAKDKAGSTGEVKTKIVIDNTPPVVSITTPQENGFVKSAVEVKGTASDANLDKYVLEMSEGPCSSAFKWALIRIAGASVEDGTLATWQSLPPDNDYCLRLTAIDKVGLTAEARINVKVDTHPPTAPVLTGKADSPSGTDLAWTGGQEAELAGYDLYRNGLKVNVERIAEKAYRDQGLVEGTATYAVKAIDLAGWESQPSNQVKVKIDVTGPEAYITAPLDGSRVSGLVDIKGMAYSADDFKQYRMYVGQGTAPTLWTLVRTSPLPVSFGLLAPWDTLGLVEGQLWRVKLEAEDTSGNITAHGISLTVDNTPPAKPVLLTASPNNADVTLTWNASGDNDLAGYLLYRNGQLANVSGTVIGNLTPYLIQGEAFADKDLPDGAFEYVLVAMDQAGNMSGQSAGISVSLDNREPHAAITEPLDNAVFGGRIPIKAESPDRDIATVQFQYQSIGDADWISMGNAVATSPYRTDLDPSALGLVHGAYRLRAVATDRGQQADSSPGYISITYADLTPPSAPLGLTVATNQGDVGLAWTASADGDVTGYNIYRTSGETRVRINDAPVPRAEYQDNAVLNGTHFYDVTALDANNNESAPSGTVVARVYAPVIAQPYTPTDQNTIQVTGSDAEPGASVEILVDNGSGFVPQAAVLSTPQGGFVANATLAPGENRISVHATDAAGNVSKNAETVVVLLNEAPATPVGLLTPVQDHDVQITWSPNTEPDLLGYNLYRDGAKLNAPELVTPAAADASSTYGPWYDPYSFLPDMAIDGDPYTSWKSDAGYAVFNHAWWEMYLPAAELISRLELHWGSEDAGDGTETLYAGKDFEIQVWSGYAWITQTKFAGNAVKDNIVDFNPSYRTDRVRVLITETTDPNPAKQVWISEINVVRDNPLLPEVIQFVDADLNVTMSYRETGLPDKEYDYTVTAVDYYGFESAQSALSKAIVGDVIAPDAPAELAAVASGSSITLTWAGNIETDLAGYNVYRNSAQGWFKINESLLAGEFSIYDDAALLNGVYAYRVTAVDLVGNESAPSDETTAIVAIVPPPAPVILGVNQVPEGGALAVMWAESGSPDVGYALYRGTGTGGPYARVNSSLISATEYLDSGLTNGVAYYYVVAAMDAIGNAGAYSNEASGIPVAAVVFEKPVILFPAAAGQPVALHEDITDIFGFGDPGAVVELENKGSFAGSATAEPADRMDSLTLSYYGEGAVLSPDGKTIAYFYNGGLWFKSLVTGAVTEGLQVNGSYILAWSPDSKKIAYSYYYDENWNNRIGIFDLTGKSGSALTSDLDVNENFPSWSPDGNRITFVRQTGDAPGIWSKDLVTGIMSPVIPTENAGNQKLSPDGKTIAYYEGESLYLYDLSDGSNSLINANTDGFSLEWSPDGNNLSFVSYQTNADGEVYILDVLSGTQTLVAGSGGYPYNIAWTADSRHIIFDIWSNTTYTETLWLSNVIARTMPTRIASDLRSIWNVNSARTGTTAIIGQDGQWNTVARLLTPQGRFMISSVSLDPGENVLTATAVDNAGNRSGPSDSVTILFDRPSAPELAISEDDVYLYPPCPVAGERMSINAVVRNTGSVDVFDAEVKVYAWNAQGTLELLTAARVPAMPTGASSLISAEWDSTGKAGENRIVVVVDPDDKILETNKSDNLAIRDFTVVDKAGLSVTTVLDGVRYPSSRNANILITIRNTGPAASAVLDVRIEDANGYPAAQFDPTTIDLAYAAETTRSIVWNTGATYAGSYVVRSVLKGASGTLLAEHTADFTIVPDTVGALTVVTDKSVYGSRESVVTSFTIRNNGTNYSIPGLQAKVSITDALGRVLFSEVKTASNLLPGASVDLNSVWNTGLTAPGDYKGLVEVFFDDGAMVAQSAVFRIKSHLVLTGTVTASASSVPVGNAVQISYTLANTGNIDALGYTARIMVLDPDTQTIMQVFDEAMDIATNTSKSGHCTVDTAGYGLKTYAVVLQTLSPDETRNIAGSFLAVKDLTPPSVFVGSPAVNGVYSDDISLSVLTSDNASGVDRVEYRIDDGLWMLLAIADPSQGRYAGSWSPTAADNGGHMLGFRATDKAGNISAVVSIGSTVQIQTDTMSPVLALSTLPDGAFTNSATLNIAGTAADNIGLQIVTVNGEAVSISADGAFSHALTLTAGPNIITMIATDLAGNTTTDTRTIILDQASPVLSIDPVKTPSNSSQQVVTGTGEAGLPVTVECPTAMVGLVSYPTGTTWQVIIADMTEGANLISVTAADPAGNVSTPVTAEILLDMKSPDTNITSGPASLTNTHAATMVFTSNEPGTTFECRIDQGETTACTSPVDYLNVSDGAHAFLVTATDSAGNADPTPASISWTVDAIPPVARISGEPSSPTRATSVLLQISGTDVVSYKYQLDIGLLSTETPVSTPIARTGLAEGLHRIFVIGKDSAGNWQSETNATTVSWLVDTESPILSISALPNNAFTNNATMNISGKATDNNAVQGVIINTSSIPLNVDGTFSELISLTTGSNMITVAATDMAGNLATDVRTVILDQAVPTVTITGPADNSVTNRADTYVAGTIDKAATATLVVNGLSPVPGLETAGTFSFPITLVYGQNTIQVTASDPAGNTGTAKRTVTLDDVTPVLSVTKPDQDVSVSQDGILLQGAVTDLDAATVTITIAVDGSTYMPSVSNGSFQQQLSFTEEKLYAVSVIAIDAAGNTTTVRRNILYDNTPPELTINPVTTPTKNSIQTMSGTREAATTVIAASSTAIIGEVGYPTDTTWQVIISNLAEGANTVSSSASDLAGNVSDPVTATIVLDTLAPVTVASPAAGVYTTALMVTLAPDEQATTYFTTDGTTPTSLSAVYSSPILVSSSAVIKYFSIDAAGNYEAIKSANYTLNAATQKYTALTCAGPQFIAQGYPVSLSAELRENRAGTPNPQGRIITISLGSQTCTGRTNAKGKASCTISAVSAQPGISIISATFKGDEAYFPSSDSANVTVFAYPSTGAFIIGDKNAVINETVTFWGSRWAKNNSLSKGSTPSSFKGYAESPRAKQVTCDVSWTSNLGNSSDPPASIPLFMGVVASSSITKSGSTLSGNSVKIVVVKTNDKYGTDPKHAGTGTVVGVFCSSNTGCNNKEEEHDEHDDDHHHHDRD